MCPEKNEIFLSAQILVLIILHTCVLARIKLHVRLLIGYTPYPLVCGIHVLGS